MISSCLVALVLYLPSESGYVQAVALHAAISLADRDTAWEIVRAGKQQGVRVTERLVDVISRRLPKADRNLQLPLIACLEHLRGDRFGESAHLVVPLLANFAENGENADRIWAVERLGNLGPKALG